MRGVALRYQTTNQAPEVTKVEAPDLNAVNLDNPEEAQVQVVGRGRQRGRADLSRSTSARTAGRTGSSWRTTCDKTEYEWDTTTTPSGVYQFKVVASDRKDNSDARGADRRADQQFVRGLPRAAGRDGEGDAGIEGDQVVIEATAASPLVRLTAASFAVNGKKWINVFPTDGLFDSKAKTFRFKTEGLKPGTYVAGAARARRGRQHRVGRRGVHGGRRGMKL